MSTTLGLAVLGVPLPLAGNGGGILFYDTFTDADGTQLAAHKPDIGTSWTALTGTPTITGNAYKPTTTLSAARTSATRANVKITARLTTGQTSGGTDLAQIVFRASDANNYWFCSIGKLAAANNYKIYENNAGITTERASGTYTYAANTGYNATATAVGSTITFLVEGLSAISYASATLNQTVDTHGVRGLTSTVVTNAPAVDTFKVEVV